MDMWIDIFDGNTAVVFCCGITFVTNINTNPKGLSDLIDKLRITSGKLTVHTGQKERKRTYVFTFEDNKDYPIFREGNILSWLRHRAINGTEDSWAVPTDCTYVLASSLWLYAPKPAITRFQNPNIRYSYISVNSDTSVLVLNQKERKVDTYTPNTIQGLLLTGLQLKPYLEITYNDTHSE